MLDELVDSNLELVFARTGASAHRRFFGTWSDATALAPLPGTPHPFYAALTVDRVKITGAGEPTLLVTGVPNYSHAYVDVEYTLEYRRPALGDPPRVTYDYGVEVLNNSYGRTWDTTGDIIDTDQLPTSVRSPLVSVNIDVAVSTVPWTALSSLAGTINEAEWTVSSGSVVLLDAQAESLLFEGAAVTGEYCFETGIWYYRVCYRFTWRSHSWNESWREAKRLWDDSAQDWARNSDGTYQYVTGAAGVAGWDTTTPKLYQSTDFTGLLP